MDQKAIDKFAQEEQKKAQVEEMRQAMLSNILKPDAKERLARIKLVKPEKALELENYLLGLAQKGGVSEPISEKSLVAMLEKMSEVKGESKVKIVRKRKDSDDF